VGATEPLLLATQLRQKAQAARWRVEKVDAFAHHLMAHKKQLFGL
jgi:hypothetical protein